MNQLGRTVKNVRLEKNLTQSELAKDICTQATISNIEKAGTIPAIPIIIAIAERLNIEINDIYGFISEELSENRKIMKQVMILCSQSKHARAEKLLTKIDEKLIDSPNEEKEYYYYKGITNLVGMQDFSNAHYYFNLANSIPLENESSIYDILANNGICIAYSMNDDDEKANTYADKTLNLLNEYLEDSYNKKYTNEIIRIYFNIAKVRSKAKNYQEAVKLCSLGINLQQLNDSFLGLENLLYEKAYNLHKLNKIKDAEEYYFYAAAMAKLNKNEITIETISKNIKEYGLMHYKY